MTHGLAQGGSRVVVFDVLGSKPENLKLVYLRSVESSRLLLNLSPNDLVEGLVSISDAAQGGGEVYVTNWLQYGAPLQGKMHPLGIRDHIAAAFQEAVMVDLPGHFTGFAAALSSLLIPRRRNPGSTVVKCKWGCASEAKCPAKCEVAVAGLVMGNGITTTPDRCTLFVNDIGRQSILVYGRGDQGELINQPSLTIPLR